MKPAPYTFPHRSRAASYREGWEEERKAERACELDAFVMEMELARPDLAPAYL